MKNKQNYLGTIKYFKVTQKYSIKKKKKNDNRYKGNSLD